MLKISVQVTGAEQAAAIIEKQAGYFDNLGPLLKNLGEELLDSTKQRFVDMVAPDGAAWAPLAPQTQVQKKKNRDKILTLSGDLSNLMHYQIRGNTLEVGSDRVYAATHQFGRGAIPARPFLGLSRTDEQSIVDIVKEHLSNV